jgi:hypothetical protein
VTSRLRIVVAGYMAQFPFGGLTWHYLQYVVGLAQLGHDVFYLEDSGKWPYNPIEGGRGTDCMFNVRYVEEVLSRFGLGDRWAYRWSGEPEWYGLAQDARDEVLASADLLINVSGALYRPDAYRQIRRMAYVDTDPVFTQIRVARGDPFIRGCVNAHDVHFSFGETLTDPVPQTGYRWIPTRQPVLLSEWSGTATAREAFTTVMNWTSYDDVEWQGRTYGQKNIEFCRFLDLPAVVAPAQLELALAPGKTVKSPYQLLRQRGWRVVDPDKACGNLDNYRGYLRSSKAEWSVAKEAYAAARSGWFSERSACYLAAGRPVVVQDTGFDAVLPVGEGIVSFSTLADAAAGIRTVEAEYDAHSRAALQIAEDYFDSSKVLERLVADALS